MNGSVGILNVGAGDTKLSFDPNNPVERIRAARIVRDMLRRGYALLVEVERDGVKKFGSPDPIVKERINVWKGNRHDDLFDGEEAVLNGRPSFLALCS